MSDVHFDFAAVLVLATVITGGIWALDALLFAPRRRPLAAHGPQPGGDAGSGRRPGEPVVVEYARSFFPVILIVLVIRSFIAEPFRIPSSSMEPTLWIGDLILVNKFSYGLRLPVGNQLILDLGKPERGDVVVFRFPKDPSKDYIKRVVGLPGDTVTYRNKQLFLNGVAVATDIIGPYNAAEDDPGLRKEDLGVEYLPGKQHEILLDPTRYDRIHQERTWTVGEGEYFVLGDNRDNSEDSRYWGFVPEDHLVGKAFLIWMHLKPSGWNRIGSVIE